MTHKQAEEPTLQVKVFSPSKIYFDDLAQSVSASNKTGQFDILPLHHNFITLLNPGTVTIKTLKDEIKSIPIEQSLLHAADGKITVFLDV